MSIVAWEGNIKWNKKTHTQTNMSILLFTVPTGKVIYRRVHVLLNDTFLRSDILGDTKMVIS